MKLFGKYLLFCLSVFPIIECNAQFDPSAQVQLPASEAQAFGDLGAIPVDLYTGRVNISIPIFTVQNQELSVPISLSYHGGGIKVTDECGLVGLGWTLNAGGVVNRIVRGMPDDLQNGNAAVGYNHLDITLNNGASNFKGFLDLMKRRTDLEQAPALALHDLRSNNISDERRYLYSQISLYGETYDNGQFDSSPDNYLFYVAGLSGAFVMPENVNDNIEVQTDDACSIEKVGPNNFMVRSIDGTRYYFEEQERQDYWYKLDYSWLMENWDVLPEQKFIYTSSWWLSRIYSASNNNIFFRYKTIQHANSISSLLGYIYESRSSYPPYDAKKRCFHNSMRALDTISAKLLDSIISPLHTIVFDYEQLSPSMSRLPKLLHIRIYSLANDTCPQERYDFEYSNEERRSKLLRITHVGKNGKTKHYAFAYENGQYIPAPEVNDKRRDIWGYFSPLSHGTFPNLDKNLFPASLREMMCNSGTRFANDATATNNMLQSILYPNGCKVKLLWEPHDFSDFSYEGRTAYTDYEYHHSDTIITYLQSDTFSLCGKENFERLTATKQLQQGDVLTIDMTQYYFMYDNYFGDTYYECILDWNCNAYIYDDRPQLTIKKNGQTWRSYDLCEYAKPTVPLIHITTDTTATYQFILSNPRSTLRHGTSAPEVCNMYYEIFNMGVPDASPYGYINVTIERNPVESIHPSQARSVGGVRIKQIQYTDTNQLLLTKNYEYIKEDGSSSGVLAYPARFSSYMYNSRKKWLPEYEKFAEEILIMLTLRSNALPFVLNSDGHITYGRVIESTQDGTRRRNQTVYTFQTSAAMGYSDWNLTNPNILSYTPADMLQLTSTKFRRGHLIEKQEITDEIKTTTYTYDVQEKQNLDTLTGSLVTLGDYSASGLLLTPDFPLYKDMAIVMYHVIPYNKRIASVQTIGTITNQREAYTYTNNTYSSSISANLPQMHTTWTAEGDTIRERYEYLSGSNKITGCITSRNGRVIAAYRNVYDNLQRLTEQYIAPLDVSNLPLENGATASSLATTKTAEFLYENNRLAQKKDLQTGITTTYLWSYNNNYPVAIIENATLQAVKNTIGTTTIQQMRSAREPDSQVLNSLRALLPYSHVETMTYLPGSGVASYTDANGFATYYTYDGFGQLEETYIVENGQKKILNHQNIHWSY